MHRKITFILVMVLSLPTFLNSIISFVAKDHPSDDGKSIDIYWNLSDQEKPIQSIDGHSVQAGITGVHIEKLDTSGVWIKITDITEEIGSYTDNDNIEPNKLARYRIVKTSPEPVSDHFFYTDAIPTEQWFNLKKLPLFVLLVILCGAVIIYIISARRGKDLYIRRINGLESMDEAVGRATEKGKPILFVPGIGDLDDFQTIAGLTILSQLAYKAATYNAELIVPVSKSMVLSTAREIVKEAFLRAGRPDAYNKDSIFYLTDDQFGYVAGIDGIMVREQPAANFFLGTFYAEALILAETGFGTGAMQTAGTAQPHQLPFFVVTCDYTLIGEELYAASAYLSKEPNQLGSLKGQDFGKLVIVLLILVGSIMEMSGIQWLKNFLTLE